MEICGFEKFSMVDWDGKIVCTVFTPGCNFRCPFCHNGTLATGRALSIPTDEVFDYLTARKNLVDGVCVSGGEPTLQPDLADFCKKLKSLGFLVKLDTNGLNPTAVKKLVGENLVDYVAMDVKNSPAKYASTAGVPKLDFAKIQETANFLKTAGIGYEFRTTIMQEFHTENDLKQIATFVDGADKYFLQRYKDGDECLSHGYTEVPKETAEEWLSFFDGKVKTTGLRGY